MNIFNKIHDRRRGTVLMVVMGMVAIGMLAVGSILSSTLCKMRLADCQVSLEQAFYVAQAGAERAATRVADGVTASSTLAEDFGEGRYVAKIIYHPQSGGDFTVDIHSTGTVKAQSRTITMRGVRRASWARYCLWYYAEALELWIQPGDKFAGPVYSRPRFHFHHQNLETKGQVEFSESASSGGAGFDVSSEAVAPIFHRGLALNAPEESMASISFPALLVSAESGGMVLYGPTTVELDGAEMLITNADEGWIKYSVPFPANGMLYVRSTNATANVDVSAPKGLQGRLTIVAESNVNIVDHIRYASDPRYDPDSTDALGLIAKKNIVIETTAPYNVDVFAHMIAVTGGFGVNDYDKGSTRGNLNVYGGIVTQIRNAVGLVGSSGYIKNYVFDIRFLKNPPPNYPKLIDELDWMEWDG